MAVQMSRRSANPNKSTGPHPCLSLRGVDLVGSPATNPPISSKLEGLWVLGMPKPAVAAWPIWDDPEPVWDVPEHAGAVFWMVPTRGWDSSAGLGVPPLCGRLRQGMRNLRHPQPSCTFESSLGYMRPGLKTQTRSDGVFGASVSLFYPDSPCLRTGPTHHSSSKPHAWAGLQAAV